MRTNDGKELPVQAVRCSNYPSTVYEVDGKMYFGWQLTPIEPREWFVVFQNGPKCYLILGPCTKDEAMEQLQKHKHERVGGEYRAFKWSAGIGG